MLHESELRFVAHRLRNLLQRVANRAEFLEMTDDRGERATHVDALMQHVEEAAAVIAELDELAERRQR